MDHTTTLGLLTALGGSAWAYHKNRCSVCKKTPEVYGQHLDRLGIVFYSSVLLGHYVQLPLAAKAIQIAPYIHGPLVLHMLITGNICPACLITAIGAVVAAQGA